jgi:hypothetical protein
MLGDATSVVVIGTSKNDFINLLGSDNANKCAAGGDFLDAGIGYNCLSAGSGRVELRLDCQGGTMTWTTITDCSASERISVWGWAPGVTFHGDLDEWLWLT